VSKKAKLLSVKFADKINKKSNVLEV